ncbi:MAG: YbbR-like domain-containing protein [Eubacteriales bacterium]
MRKAFTKNLGWKILSIVFAILLWLVVINIDDPWVSDEVKEIKVQIRNNDVITSQKKDVELKEGETITVKVSGKRTVVDNLTSEDIIAEADMRQISFLTNSVPISVNSTKPIEIIRWYPERVLVNIEDVKSIQGNLQSQIKGSPRAPYVISDIIMQPNSLMLTGPESQINKVKSVIVDIEIDEDNTSDITLDAIPQILDENNNEVTDIDMNVEKVKVIVNIEKKKDVPLIFETKGEMPENYVLTKFTYHPRTLKIQGKEAEIDDINRIVLPEYDISELKENTTYTVNIKELPQFANSNIKFEGGNSEATVQLEVEELIEKDMIIPLDNIDVKYMPRNLQFHYNTEEDIRLTIKGRESIIKNIDEEDILGRISLIRLEAGSHDVSVDFDLPNGVKIIGEPPIVNIALEEDEVEEVEEQ